MKKKWKEIEKEVEAEYGARYHSVPEEKRRKLGLEPDQTGSYENRQWVQIYLQKILWREKCRDIMNNPEYYGLQEFKIQEVKDD
tara:strand:- start:3024 stop:3275 length:252 start_codon:yes stop_codon:yes gene_type:complete